MTTKRIKTNEIGTLEEFNKTVDLAATIDNEIRQLEAMRDSKIHEIQAAYNARLGRKESEMDKHVARCELYAKKHRAILLGKRKSAKTPLAIFGFRKSTKLKAKRETPVIVAALDSSLSDDEKKKYLIEEIKLQKATIKKDVLGNETLQEHFEIESKDTFFIEAKTDKAEQPEG